MNKVCTNQTGHVEAVQITFDPEVTSFENILDIYFKTFDQLMIKGNFSIEAKAIKQSIFYHDEHQKRLLSLKATIK